MTKSALSPRERASAADTLDELGYTPSDLYKFISIPNSLTPNLLVSKYLITNAQYERFLKPENFKNEKLWLNFEKYDENSKPMKENWGDEAWTWLQKALQNKNYETQDGVLLPRYWRDARFGINRKHAPVVGVSWYEASAYCQWLLQNWDELDEGKQDLPKPKLIRLPLETEWAFAAGGEDNNRFAFGGEELKDKITEYANTNESGIGRTTPVWMYLKGVSKPYELMDMSGNVWEWQANFYNKDHNFLALRGGSWGYTQDRVRVSGRDRARPDYAWGHAIGFRVLVVPPSPHL